MFLIEGETAAFLRGEGAVAHAVDGYLPIAVFLGCVAFAIVFFKGYRGGELVGYAFLSIFCAPLALVLAIIKPNLAQERQKRAQNELNAKLDSQAYANRIRTERLESELQALRKQLDSKTVQPQANHQDMTDQQPFISARCMACGKTTTASKALLISMSSCPQCGAFPFGYIRVAEK